jgi:hypothetical protein
VLYNLYEKWEMIGQGIFTCSGKLWKEHKISKISEFGLCSR